MGGDGEGREAQGRLIGNRSPYGVRRLAAALSPSKPIEAGVSSRTPRDAFRRSPIPLDATKINNREVRI